jgi:AAA domain
MASINTEVISDGVFNFKELMALNIERPKEIIEGLLCERQNALLMGRFGVGKTMFGTQMTLHLATGREFLGRKIARPVKTMYLDFENDLGDIKDRLNKQSSALALTDEERAFLESNWAFVDSGDPERLLYGMKLDQGAGEFEPLVMLVKEHKPEVLVIDNLGLVATKGDLKETEDAAAFYANLKILRSADDSLKNGAIVVFHHLTKPGEREGASTVSLLTSPYEFLSRARGTGRLLDFARARLALAQETIGNTPGCYVLNGINRSLDLAALILQFNQETLSFERHDDQNLRFDAAFGTRPRAKEIYLQLPEEFAWSQAEAIVDPKTNRCFNKGTLSEALKLGVKNGFMVQDAAKRYKKVFSAPAQ